MHLRTVRSLFLALLAGALVALGLGSLPKHALADDAAAPISPALTIYNKNFAVVRQPVDLNLKQGANTVQFNGTTAHLEPDSVMLRDPTGKHSLQVLEQDYRADQLSQDLLLSMNEGKTLEFEVMRDGKKEIVSGKLVRSGYAPHPLAWQRYGQQYYQTQLAMMGGYNGETARQPIVEMDGRLFFGLPGQPIFHSLGQDTILKPTLDWTLRTDQAGAFQAELSYVTGGMSWLADYNAVAPVKGDDIDLTGWVTMDNQSGKDFHNSQIQLMAGDVNKLTPGGMMEAESALRREMADAKAMSPQVTEQTFDEYHLYSLARRVSLRDRETKQVEFLQASKIHAQPLYVYDGARIASNRYAGWTMDSIRQDQSYGTESNPSIWVMRELKNSAANHLGMPLPKGRLRFYRRDESGQLQFVGEGNIQHTPADETLRIYTGNAFDLAGERRRTDYKVDNNARWIDETFEIKLRNHKKEPVEVRAVEHLYRWSNWQITQKKMDYDKIDSRTIEFRAKLAPNAEQVVTYTVHYSW